MSLDNKKFYYRVYGLNIESEICIPQFTAIDNINEVNIDTKIYYKRASIEIKEAIKNGTKTRFTYNDMWFYVENLAIYRVYDGDKIEVELYDNADLYMVNMYILGTVLGLVLLQKNMVAIHGGAIVINEKGCVFTGDKGAGKSTLTTALRQMGYGFVADDVASINLDGDTSIYPGFAYQKLCEDTMDKLGYNKEEFIPFDAGKHVKYIVPAHEKFVYNEVDFHTLFEISVGDVDEVRAEELVGTEKLQNIIRNIFNVSVLHNSGGIPPTIFKKCMDMCKNIKCFRIIRPKDKFTVDEQIKIIEEILA